MHVFVYHLEETLEQSIGFHLKAIACVDICTPVLCLWGCIIVCNDKLGVYLSLVYSMTLQIIAFYLSVHDKELTTLMNYKGKFIVLTKCMMQ